jgi:hypothetical protein
MINFTIHTGKSKRNKMIHDICIPAGRADTLAALTVAIGALKLGDSGWASRLSDLSYDVTEANALLQAIRATGAVFEVGEEENPEFMGSPAPKLEWYEKLSFYANRMDATT